MKKVKIDLKYVVFAVLLIIVYGIVFFVPGSSEKFSLDPSVEGDYWRFGSYQFAHLNWAHLIQNMVTLALVSFIAIELKTQFKFFSVNYLLAGLVAILPLWIISPFVALGASAAIFSSFGYVSPEAKQFRVKVWLVVLVILGFIFYKPVFILIGSGEGMSYALKQSLAHFSGFVFGLAGFYVFQRVDKLLLRRKQHVLRRI